jgi:hypothetical protein
MRCDECKFWNCAFPDNEWSYGECEIKLGEKFDYYISGDYSGVRFDTERDFFCAAFEGKDDE